MAGNKTRWTLGEGLGILVSIVILLGAIWIGFQLYFDVQRLKDETSNQQAYIYQLENKIKKLCSYSLEVLNSSQLPVKEKRELAKQIQDIETNWDRYSDNGKNKTQGFVSSPE